MPVASQTVRTVGLVKSVTAWRKQVATYCSDLRRASLSLSLSAQCEHCRVRTVPSGSARFMLALILTTLWFRTVVKSGGRIYLFIYKLI